MRKRLNRPTDSELVILQALWRLGPATVRQVEAYQADQGGDVGYAALLRMMQSMAEKGLLARDDGERAHVYKAALPREEVQGTLLDDFLARAFGGDALQLLAATLSRQAMSPADREEAARLLAKARKEQP